MRCLFISTCSLFAVLTMFAQDDLESECFKRINATSASQAYPKFSGKIFILTDTFYFENSIITVGNSSEDTREILRQGLLYPALIAGASTGGDLKVTISTLRFFDPISITNPLQLSSSRTDPKIIRFSFLLWRKGFANPLLYIFELSNDTANKTTTTTEFIKNAKLSAFGFCSILL